MKGLKILSFLSISMGLIGLVISPAFAQSKTYTTSKQVDVEYNATANSPTLPLQQTPPPQNYPNSVTLGVPSYYYYYYPPVGYYGGAPYGGGSQGGVIFTNTGGRTQRSFWYTTPIPGQIAPPVGGSFYGPGYGGYGSGFYNPGNYLFMR